MFTSYGPTIWSCEQVWKEALQVFEVQVGNIIKSKGLVGIDWQIEKKPYEKSETTLLSYSRKPNKALNLPIKVF